MFRVFNNVRWTQTLFKTFGEFQEIVIGQGLKTAKDMKTMGKNYMQV